MVSLSFHFLSFFGGVFGKGFRSGWGAQSVDKAILSNGGVSPESFLLFNLEFSLCTGATVHRNCILGEMDSCFSMAHELR